MGRDKYSSRHIVEYLAGVRIQDLLNYEILNRGGITADWTTTITQNGYMELANVKVTVKIGSKKLLSENNYIQFEYCYDGNNIKHIHPIETQPVHFGGNRYYFRCNCMKNGKKCMRRVKALYFGGNVWACRHCLELVYQNCRYHRDESTRLRNNAEILQKKADSLRKYRHPRKANILEWKAYDYELKSDESFLKRFHHLFGKYA